MEPIALSLLVALAIIALIRMPGVFSPVLAVEGLSPWRPVIPGDDEEQMPETDRAPRRQWLPYGVAAMAAVRVALLVAMHA